MKCLPSGLSRLAALSLSFVVLSVGVAACGGDDTSTDSTPPSTSTIPSTSIAVTTTAQSSTTSSSTSTSTTSTTTSTSTTVAPTTSTTIPTPGAPLVLRSNGLGDALFGAEAESVISYVSSFIGAPTTDSGWVDPFSLGACPGSELRVVTWNDLSLFFSDDTQLVTGVRHFFSYQYGEAFGPTINPYGLKTDGLITVGSSVGSLRATYPSAAINEADDISSASFQIELGLAGYISTTADDGIVTQILGGFGCGE